MGIFMRITSRVLGPIFPTGNKTEDCSQLIFQTETKMQSQITLNETHERLLFMFTTVSREIDELKSDLRACVDQRKKYEISDSVASKKLRRELLPFIESLRQKLELAVSVYDAAYLDYSVIFGPIVRQHKTTLDEAYRIRLSNEYSFLAANKAYFGVTGLRELIDGKKTEIVIKRRSQPANQNAIRNKLKQTQNLCQTCGKDLSFDDISSCFICVSCGTTVKTEQYQKRIAQNNNKQKEHYFTWSARVQGREKWPPELEEAYPLIDAEVTQQGYERTPSGITTKTVRSILQNLELTKFNPNIISIHAKLIDRPPIKIPREEENEFYETYEKVSAVCHEISGDNSRKFKYYPHAISKIIQSKYGRGGGKYRELILNIHVQSDKTTTKNDLILCQAFEKLGLTFYQT
jgi:predicted RNA-binding Zn-ribbon protein involved in translation (DUF1610 family)